MGLPAVIGRDSSRPWAGSGDGPGGAVVGCASASRGGGGRASRSRGGSGVPADVRAGRRAAGVSACWEVEGLSPSLIWVAATGAGADGASLVVHPWCAPRAARVASDPARVDAAACTTRLLAKPRLASVAPAPISPPRASAPAPLPSGPAPPAGITAVAAPLTPPRALAPNARNDVPAPGDPVPPALLVPLRGLRRARAPLWLPASASMPESCAPTMPASARVILMFR